MSHIDDDAGRYAAASPTWTFRSLFGKAARLITALNTRSRERMDLLKLDDRMLADVGLTREQAGRLANQLFRRI